MMRGHWLSRLSVLLRGILRRAGGYEAGLSRIEIKYMVSHLLLPVPSVAAGYK
jgi:hypothetical protein